MRTPYKLEGLNHRCFCSSPVPLPLFALAAVCSRRALSLFFGSFCLRFALNSAVVRLQKQLDVTKVSFLTSHTHRLLIIPLGPLYLRAHPALTSSAPLAWKRPSPALSSPAPSASRRRCDSSRVVALAGP